MVRLLLFSPIEIGNLPFHSNAIFSNAHRTNEREFSSYSISIISFVANFNLDSNFHQLTSIPFLVSTAYLIVDVKRKHENVIPKKVGTTLRLIKECNIEINWASSWHHSPLIVDSDLSFFSLFLYQENQGTSEHNLVSRHTSSFQT